MESAVGSGVNCLVFSWLIVEFAFLAFLLDVLSSTWEFFAMHIHREIFFSAVPFILKVLYDVSFWER